MIRPDDPLAEAIRRICGPDDDVFDFGQIPPQRQVAAVVPISAGCRPPAAIPYHAPKRASLLTQVNALLKGHGSAGPVEVAQALMAISTPEVPNPCAPIGSRSQTGPVTPLMLAREALWPHPLNPALANQVAGHVLAQRGAGPTP
jgi:hypothetical protein